MAGTARQQSEAPKPLSLRRNFSWVMLANVVSAVVGLGRVLVLVHLGNPEMIGQVALALALCIPVSGLANLGLRNALVTDAKHAYQFADYLGLRLITTVLAFLVVVGIVMAVGYELEMALIILVVALGKMVEFVSDIFHALLQQHERMDHIAIALMLRGPLALLLLGLGVYLTGSVLWGIAGFPLATAVTFFGYDLPCGWRIVNASPLGRQESTHETPIRSAGLGPRWNARTLAGLAWLTLPLGVVAMMFGLGYSIPRYMVNYYLGSHSLGIFAAIAALATMETMVVTSIGNSTTPRLAKYYAAGKIGAFCGLLGKLVALVICLGVAIVLLMALLGRPILDLLYGAQFAQHADLAVYLMLATAVMCLNLLLGKAVAAIRYFKADMIIRSAAIVVLVLVLPGLIGTSGLKGAALAILAGATFSTVGYALVILSAVGGEGRVAGEASSKERPKESHSSRFDGCHGAPAAGGVVDG